MLKLILVFISTFLFADIKVATAANVSFAMKDLVKEFQKQNNINIKIIIGSSGKLTSQIENGAPFDIFLSADMKYPKYLYLKGVSKTKPKKYANGKLILFSKHKIKSIKDILKANKIAIANPNTAPYGKATIKYLQNSNLYKKLKHKFVIGSNISSAFSYGMKITDYAFIAKSLLFKFPHLNNKNHYIDLDPSKYTPIQQGVILLTNNKNAEKFYNFIFSKTAQKIFIKYGYEITTK